MMLFSEASVNFGAGYGNKC